MNRSDFQLSTSDGLSLHASGWSPPGDPVGTIVLVHGLGEHSGRYDHVGEFFAAAGYEVVAYDQRGHGHSNGPRGHAPSYARLLDDLEGVLLGVQDGSEREPPLFFYGHSLGGGLVLNYALRRQAKLAGVIASSPLLLPAEKPPAWKVHTGKLLNRWWPTLGFTVGIDPAARSHNPQVAVDYAADPLTHGRVSARLGVEMLRESRWAVEHARGLAVPTLLMHGDADLVTSPEASRRFAAASGADLRVWPGKLHELHWENNRDEVLKCVLEWLEAQR